MNGLRYLEDVSTLALAPGRCTGCGACFDVCPHAVFDMRDGKAAIADLDACIECGACSKNCPAGALKVRPGVGCAAAIIRGWVTGAEPSCGCDGAC